MGSIFVAALIVFVFDFGLKIETKSPLALYAFSFGINREYTQGLKRNFSGQKCPKSSVFSISILSAGQKHPLFVHDLDRLSR